jgi:flagellar biosynthesis protein FlhA
VVVEELTPTLLTLGEVQRVLHALLEEGVSIRDLVRIYEALSVAAKGGADTDRLVEAARAALAPAIAAQHATEGHLDVITVDPRLQQAMLESLRPADGGAVLLLPPGMAEAVVATVVERHRSAVAAGHSPVLVCAAQIRGPLRRLIGLSVPGLPVLSFPEIAAGSVAVNAIGVVDDVLDAVPGG